MQIANRSVWILLLWIAQSVQADGPSFAFLRDKIISNQQALGNADVHFEIEYSTFGKKGKVNSDVLKSQRIKVFSQFAKDGSLLSELSGGLTTGSASLYLLKDGGLMRYFAHAQLAKIEASSTNHPDWTIDPQRCTSSSGHVAVQDAVQDSRFVVKSVEHREPGIVRLVGVLPTKMPSIEVVWTFDCDKQNNFLPTYFSGGIKVRGKSYEMLMDGVVTYKKTEINDCFFPTSWRRTTYFNGLETSEEIGEVSKLVAYSRSYRDTMDVRLPVGTRIVDGVAQKVTLVTSGVENRWMHNPYGYVIVCASVLVSVMLFRRWSRK